MTLDPELQRLAFTPFVRAHYIARVERLFERYQLALKPDLDRVTTMRLLFEFPSALFEQSSIDRPKLEARLESARLELANLRAAAPLPPPSDRAERTIVLAFADLQYLMLEMRAIRRMLRRLPPAPLVEWYRRRADPLDPLDADIVRAIGRIRRGGLLKACAAIAGIRYGIFDLRHQLAPERPKGPPPALVFACRASEVPEGCARKIEAHGRAIALYKDGGHLFAIDDVCPHRGGPLHQGEVENGAAICPLHGWAFDLATGTMRGNPRVKLPIYELELRGDEVFVGGEVEKK